jgi:hypothetical protein
MKKLFFIFITLFLAGMGACKKDILEDSFTRGGNNLLRTTDGNLLIAGFNSNKTNGFDAFLIKTDLTGSEIWRNYFGTSASDGFYSVQNTSDGGYIASGFTNNSANAISSLFIVKTDANGNQLWKASFGNSNNAQGLCVIPTIDTGYISCGFIQSTTDAARDMYFVKVNSKGELVWEKTYGTSNTEKGNDIAYSLIQTNDGGFLITGSLDGEINCCGHACIMKLSSTGDSLWTKTYNGENGYSIAKTADNGFIVGGTSQSTDTRKLCLLRIDASGNMIWEKTYGENSFEYGTAVVSCSDGGFALTGLIGNDVNNHEICLLRTTGSGDQTWIKTFGGSGVDQGYGLIQFQDNGFGITGSYNSGGSNIFLNKTDPAGVEVWRKLIN